MIYINKYDSLLQASERLTERGFKESFKLEDNHLKGIGNKKIYSPKDMSIIEYHRFEGLSDPSDTSIIFAVECLDGTKGTIISSYGTYNDIKLTEFMDKVRIKERATSN